MPERRLMSIPKAVLIACLFVIVAGAVSIQVWGVYSDSPGRYDPSTIDGKGPLVGDYWRCRGFRSSGLSSCTRDQYIRSRVGDLLFLVAVWPLLFFLIFLWPFWGVTYFVTFAVLVFGLTAVIGVINEEQKAPEARK